MNRLAVGALVALVLSLSIFGQSTAPPNAPRGVLEGSVVDSVTGQPIEGAQVAIVTGQALPEEGVKSLLSEQKSTLQSPQVTKVLPALVLSGRTLMPERSAHSVFTNTQGRFTFTGLTAGTYTLSLRADGYNFQVYGQKPGSLAALPIDVREAKVDIGVFRMNPEPRISGTILDVDAVPVAGIPVYLLNAQPMVNVDGQKQFRVVGETTTDAMGKYVLEKISGGRYCVAAGSFGKPELIRFPAAPLPTGERPAGIPVPAVTPHPFTFYPGVRDIGLAGRVEVVAGAKVLLPDLVLPKEQLKTIQGRVVDYATGRPPDSVRVTLNGWFPFPRAGRDSREVLNVANYDRTTGMFEFKNLIPGQYRVDASLPRPQTSTRQPGVPLSDVSPQSAFQILELKEADVSDVVLPVPGIGSVKGKVTVADGKAMPVAQTNLPIPLQLMLRPLNPLQPAPTVTAVSTEDGSFEVTSGLDGKYRFTLGPLRDNYYVSEARLDGAPVANGILSILGNSTSELIFALSPGGQIQGAVVDKNGQVVKQAQGIVLPDPLPEVIAFYKNFQANSSGSFTVDGVPPGNYRVYIWETIEPAQFFDRDLLARSRSSAVAVHVEKGSTVSVSVQTIGQ
jgi:protocatechuate 3,4-dioxygenase beta subunit